MAKFWLSHPLRRHATCLWIEQGLCSVCIDRSITDCSLACARWDTRNGQQSVIYLGGHTVQSVTEEVLVTYLELSRASWDFLVPMDLSRPPNNILIKILRHLRQEIQKISKWAQNCFFPVLKFEIWGEASFHGTAWDRLNLGSNESPWLNENPHVHEGCERSSTWAQGEVEFQY